MTYLPPLYFSHQASQKSVVRFRAGNNTDASADRLYAQLEKVEKLSNQDPQEARAHLFELAERGDSHAQYLVGLIFLNPEESFYPTKLLPDPVFANYCFGLAAQKANAPLKFKIAEAYLSLDKPKAKVYLEQAVQQGSQERDRSFFSKAGKMFEEQFEDKASAKNAYRLFVECFGKNKSQDFNIREELGKAYYRLAILLKEDEPNQIFEIRTLLGLSKEYGYPQANQALKELEAT
jgi:TPR repeat protein